MSRWGVPGIVASSFLLSASVGADFLGRKPVKNLEFSEKSRVELHIPVPVSGKDQQAAPLLEYATLTQNFVVVSGQESDCLTDAVEHILGVDEASVYLCVGDGAHHEELESLLACRRAPEFRVQEVDPFVYEDAPVLCESVSLEDMRL